MPRSANPVLSFVLSLAFVAVLENESGESTALWADHLIGRAPEAALRLGDQGVSWRHASVRWTGRVWELQDLGSRNGTFVNNQRVEVGTRVPLRIGAQLRFGVCPDVWLVVDLSPPEASATALDDGTRVTPLDGLIALPGVDTPEVSLYRGADGAWVAEGPDRVWEPARDEIIVAAGRGFRFEPGSAVHATSTNFRAQATPATIALEFSVSRNEEQVDLCLVHEGQRVALKSRAHSYLLLTLARARLSDQSEPALPATSHGWVEQGRLLRMLATTLPQLSLDIYRARRQFSDAGVVDSAQIIERRTSSRELRIGVSRLQIATS